MAMPVIPPIFHVVAAVLATYRLTELVTIDRITQGLRMRMPSYLLSCSRCMSIWAGAVASLVYFVAPALNWPLALAWVYIVLRESARPYVKIKIVPAGGVQITTGLTNIADVRAMLISGLSLVQSSASPQMSTPLPTPEPVHATTAMNDGKG